MFVLSCDSVVTIYKIYKRRTEKRYTIMLDIILSHFQLYHRSLSHLNIQKYIYKGTHTHIHTHSVLALALLLCVSSGSLLSSPSPDYIKLFNL